MNTYTIGTLVRIQVTFKVSTTATDPTTVTVRVFTPNKKILSAIYGTDIEVYKTGTGVYYLDTIANEIGKYTYRFEGTGVCQIGAEGTFMVAQSPFFER